MNLTDFAHDFFQGIEEEWAEKGGLTEHIFVERMRQYLSENGVIANDESAFWLKSQLGMKVNAYSYDEEENRLALFVAEYEHPTEKIGTISRTDVVKSFKRVVKFFEYAATRNLKDSIDEAYGEAHDLATLIEQQHKTLKHLDIFLLTNSIYKSNELVELAVKGVEDVTYQIWDIERVFQLVNELQGIEAITIDFEEQIGETFSMIKVPSVPGMDTPFECYLGYIPGTLLAKAYKQWGQRLIERNVRSYLQARGKVNKGIKETLQKKKDMFIAYNNGISTTAEDAVLTPVSEGSNLYTVDTLSGWQIVNGGQTTASLYHAWDSGINIDDVYIQAKLTVLKTSDEYVSRDLISRISQYANTQNKISFSDLGANDPIHVSLEHFSRTIWAPDVYGRKSEKKWYYERARGQYLVDMNRQPTKTKKNQFAAQNPKEQVVTKTQLAKYYMAWEQFPHTVGKGNEYNFSAFMDYLTKDSEITIDADFFKQAIARAMLFNTCDKLVAKMDLPGYKANVVAYTLAMTAYAAGDRIDLLSIWNNQRVNETIQDLLQKVAEITWEFISNPPSVGTNISQWCKKEECWNAFKKTYGIRIEEIATSLHLEHQVINSFTASGETAASSET